MFSSTGNDKVWRVLRSVFAGAPDEYIARARADGFQLWEHEQIYVPSEPCERLSEHKTVLLTVPHLKKQAVRAMTPCQARFRLPD